jgi:integrase
VAKRGILRPAPPEAALLTAHAAEWAGTERFFVSRDGSPMRGNAVYQAFVRARPRVGLTELSFHDLRHTGHTLAAATGATLADLKRRLGHSSAVVAALRYLQACGCRELGHVMRPAHTRVRDRRAGLVATA